MRWNRLDIQVDFERFFNIFSIIEVIPNNKEKPFDVRDFNEFSLTGNYVESVCFFKDSNGEDHVFALIKYSNRKYFSDTLMFYHINLSETFCNILSNINDRKRLIAQLAFNKCAKLNINWGNLSGFCYVNVTGDFISKENNAKKNKQQIFLDFRISKKLFLAISVQTYSRSDTFHPISSDAEKKKREIENFKKKPAYIIDTERELQFRRAIPQKDKITPKNTYRHFSNRPKNKNVVPFLSLEKNYDSCKLCYLRYLMQRLKNDEICQDNVLAIKFEENNFHSITTTSKNNVAPKGKFKNFIKINMLYVQRFQLFFDKDCKDISSKFESALSNLNEKYKSQNLSFSYDEIHDFSDIKFDLPLLIIIHEKDYYKNNNVEDTYWKTLSKSYQHITYEALLQDTIEPIIKKSLQELALKHSIAFKKSPIIAMNNNESDFVFALPFEKYTLQDNTRYKPTLNFAICFIENKVFNYYMASDKEAIFLKNAYRNIMSPLQFGEDFEICCFYWKKDAPHSIHSILRIKYAVQIPNYELIDNIHERNKKAKKFKIPVSTVKEMFHSYLSANGIIDLFSNIHINEIIDALAEGNQIEAKMLINKQSPLSKFVDTTDFYLWNLNKNNPFHNIPLVLPGWRNKKVLPLLDLPYNMGFGEISLPFINKEFPAYFSGYKTGYDTFSPHHALRLYTVYSLNSADNPDFEKIIPMMDTDFIIPFDAFSVLPYPVKLLREFVKMNETIKEKIDFNCSSFKNKDDIEESEE